MVDAVVNVLLEKLLNNLAENGRILTGYQKEFQELQKELQRMQLFLKDAERQKRKNESLRSLLAELQEFVYEAQDILADCQICDSSDGNEQRSSYSWLSHVRPLKFPSRFKNGKRMKEINNRIKLIYEEFDRHFKLRTSSNIGSDRWSSSEYDHTQVIGLEGDKKKIKEWLLRSEEKEILMVAFVGMGGLGKTTIAQEVFNDKEIDNRFERRIWVSVSQTSTDEQIMRNILRNLGDVSAGDDRGALLQKIKQYLQGKRYLIVMDDVWDSNSKWWEKIHQVLPKNQGGAVIVTTRQESVVSRVQARDKTHRPDLLSFDNSWLLFCKIAFAGTGGECRHPELEPVGKDIVKKCKGLPLTIKAVGGNLLHQEPVYHEWKRIADNFQEELKENENISEIVMASLQLSYDELPPHLKPCFLSLALYPEDCIVPKTQLVHWWMGEGFVPLRNSIPRTRAAEDCFSGLTNRCLLQAVDKTYSGTILTCNIHDMVRDLAIKIAEEDAFFNLKGFNGRHLGISENLDEKQIKLNLKLRGIMSTTKIGEVNKLESNLAKRFTGCRYLRALDVSKSIFDTPLSQILDKIDCLPHLNYLSLSNTHPLIHLPDSMENLHNLQILDVSYCQNLKYLQSFIVSFKNLRVLDMTNCGSLDCCPKGIGSLVDLEVLLGFKPARSNKGARINELRNLSKLRKLGLCMTWGDQIGEDESDSLLSLKNLQSLSINCYDSCSDDLISKLEILSPAPQLHELSLQFYPGTSSPSWLNPNSLPMMRYLSICSGNLKTMHKTFWGTGNGGNHWRIEGLMLNSLSELHMEWEVLQRAMPVLRSVNADWCPELERFPIEDIGFKGGVWTKTAPHKS